MTSFKNKKTSGMSVRKGLSLVEVLVSMFVFTVIMASLASFFGASVNSHRMARDQQKNLEAAQEAMNLVAKSVRGSKVLYLLDYGSSGNPMPPNAKTMYHYKTGWRSSSGYGAGDSANSIAIFNYSRGTCEQFAFVIKNGKGQLEFKTSPGTINSSTGDVNCSWGNYTVLVSNLDYAKSVFLVYPSSGSDPFGVGRATMVLQVGSDNNHVTLQTTVSLRDYETVNLDD